MPRLFVGSLSVLVCLIFRLVPEPCGPSRAAFLGLTLRKPSQLSSNVSQIKNMNVNREASVIWPQFSRHQLRVSTRIFRVLENFSRNSSRFSLIQVPIRQIHGSIASSEFIAMCKY